MKKSCVFKCLDHNTIEMLWHDLKRAVNAINPWNLFGWQKLPHFLVPPCRPSNIVKPLQIYKGNSLLHISLCFILLLHCFT